MNLKPVQPQVFTRPVPPLCHDSSFVRFRMSMARPHIPYRFTLGSFVRFRMSVARPHIPYRFTLGSFVRFAFSPRTRASHEFGPMMVDGLSPPILPLQIIPSIQESLTYRSPYHAT